MPTLLCVPILVSTEHEALADAEAAKAAGADIVEFRIDELFSGIDGDEKPILRLIAGSPLPCIVTCRAASEGGHYDGDDMARVSLYERLGTASGKGETPPRFLDIEFATYSRSQNLKQKVNLAVDYPAQHRDLAPSLILSAHDFQSRPADLTRRVLAMAAEPACKIVKVAFRARSLRDNLELFELLATRAKPTIALAMGEFGLISRILAPKFHGFLTFAALRKEAATAPGQPTVAELLSLYRFRKITPRTKVYGIVGWPVGHSMSPLVHNAGFDAINHDGVYLPLPIPSAPTPEKGPSPTADDHYTIFKATLADLVDDPRLDLAGLSVTIPHKEHLVRFARDRGWVIDPLVEAVGAANTLAVDRDASGKVTLARILNTDVAGVVEPMTEAIHQMWRGASRPPPLGLNGVPIAVIGAGGSARAAIYGLSAAGALVTIHNRDLAKAHALAGELSAKSGHPIAAAPLQALPASNAAAFVNCTPIGMKGGPAPEAEFIPVQAITTARNCKNLPLIFDAVYNPLKTPALAAAEKAAWKIEAGAGGVGMFVRQAEHQFAAWTGRSPPAGLFDRLVRERLSPA